MATNLKSTVSLGALTANLPDFRNTFDPVKGYQGLLFHSNRYLGAHELVHVQEIRRDQHQRLADTLYRDGALMPGGGRVVLGEPVDGEIDVTLAGGRVYIRGAIHDLSERVIRVSATGTVIIGARLAEKVVTWLNDETLKGVAPGTRAQNEPMASALSMLTRWGYDGDGEDGSLYPIYTIRDGVLIDETPPPALDPYTSLLERYDREAHGGYIVDGFRVTALGPDGAGNQKFSVSEGVINVYGSKITRSVSLRLVSKEEPDLELVQAEPIKCVGNGPHRLTPRFGPIAEVTQVTVLAERTVSITHGPYAGAVDSLPDPTVQEILSVKQGTVTFSPENYSLLSAAISWAGSKQEPSPGSRYDVTYRYYHVVTPDEVGERHLVVSGAAPDTMALIHYRFKLPRIDAICVDRYGNLLYVKGISSRLSPQPLEVDPTLIKVADVYVVWGGTPRVEQVGTVRMEMTGMRSIEKMLGNAYALIADLRLKYDITAREPAAKLGIFADPLLDDDLRDQGILQTGAIVGGSVCLPIAATVIPLSVPPSSLPFEDEVLIEQSFVTEEHKINPYMAFAAPPVVATLNPAVDIWAEEVTNWTSVDTARFVDAAGSVVSNPALGSQWEVSGQWTEKQVLDSRVETIEYIRQRSVHFEIEGFGPGERLIEVTFDGVAVTP